MTWRTIAGHDFIILNSIASLLHVSRATVGRWIKEGDPNATTLPSGHYRTSAADYLELLTRHQLPVPIELLDFDTGVSARKKIAVLSVAVAA